MFYRTIATLLFVFAMLGFAAFPGTAQAAPRTVQSAHVVQAPTMPLYGCSGNGCNGRSPSVTGCNSGSVVAGGGMAVSGIYDGNGTYVGAVYLYWSSGCQTNWNETFMVSNHCANIEHANVYRQAGSDGSALTVGSTYSQCVIVTDMVYASHEFAQACTSVVDNTVGANYCTGWY